MKRTICRGGLGINWAALKTGLVLGILVITSLPGESLSHSQNEFGTAPAAPQAKQKRPPLEWKGKPASYWIARLNVFDAPGGGVSAEEFLFVAGPDIMPELIRGLSRPDRYVQDRWNELYLKSAALQHVFPLPTGRRDYRANCALGLAMLGKAASSAVPALLVALHDSDAYVRSKAAEALGRIGWDAPVVVPLLSAGLSDKDAPYRLSCVMGLARFVADQPAAGDALRIALQNPDPEVRKWAAKCLWQEHSKPAASFKGLVAALRDIDVSVRCLAARSLGQMSYDAPRAATVLSVALEKQSHNDPSPEVFVLVESLGKIGPGAQAAVPMLTKLLAASTYPHTVTECIIALSRIEPNNPQRMEALIEHLKEEKDGAFWTAMELGRRGSAARGALPALCRLAETTKDRRTKAMAATAAWRLDPSQPNPIKLLIALALGSPEDYEAIILLGELGQEARAAVPALLQLRYGRGVGPRYAAEAALESIAPEYLTDAWRR